MKTWLKEFETNAFYFVFKKSENNKHTYVIDTQSSFKYPVSSYFSFENIDFLTLPFLNYLYYVS